jgi:hypothetical protein
MMDGLPAKLLSKYDELHATARDIVLGWSADELEERIQDYGYEMEEADRLGFQHQGETSLLSLAFIVATVLGGKVPVVAQCVICDKEFVAKTRRMPKYCSNACRFKTYRARKKRARQLHADGVSLADIADAMGSDAATIAGWVGDESQNSEESPPRTDGEGPEGAD